MSFSVIIPSKNAANLVPCVRAIREAGETCRIIVVDDGVGNWRGLDDIWQRSDLIVPGVKPFVFARNVNIGIDAAGEDDVIVLNDDALLKTPHGFTFLNNVSTFNPEYGIIAATCNNVGNPNQHQQKGTCLRLEERMVCFVCVYIPRRTINQCGLMDERYVDYGMDDDDYSFTVRAEGLKLGVFDGCYVDHGSLQSSYRSGPQVGGDFTANMRRFIEKWGTDNWSKRRENSQFAHLFPKDAA